MPSNLACIKSDYFNPRPPRGGRPSLSFDASPICFISIHALREESDLDATLAITCRMYFNPRPPRGERQRVLPGKGVIFIFQSTPSARRATLFINAVSYIL